MSDRIEHAVIPCAGHGTRMKGIGGGRAKELLTLDGKPLVHWAVEEAFGGNVSRVILVLRPGKEALLEYFQKAPIRDDLRIDGSSRRVEAVYQEEATGLADAIEIAWRTVRPDPLALLLPYNIYDGVALRDLRPAYRATRLCTVGLVMVSRSDWEGFGNCGAIETRREGRWLRIEKLASKRKGSFRGPPGVQRALRWFGRSILTSRFFEVKNQITYPAGREKDDVPLFQRLIRTEGITGVLLKGKGFDVGNEAGFRRAEGWLGGRQ